MICPSCGSDNTKKLKESTGWHSTTVTLTYFCRACEHTWTVEREGGFFPPAEQNTRRKLLRDLTEEDLSQESVYSL